MFFLLWHIRISLNVSNEIQNKNIFLHVNYRFRMRSVRSIIQIQRYNIIYKVLYYLFNTIYYSYKGDLNKHKRAAHAAGYLYGCPHCDKRFPQSYELNEHMAEHTAASDVE